MLNPEYGYWNVSIEKNGRMRMPTELLKALPEDERKSFFVTHGFGNHVMLWTSQAFRKRMDIMNTLNKNDIKVKTYRNAFLRDLTNIECDVQNRVVIPKAFLETYNIDKEVVIVLDNGQIEIWSKEEFKIFDLNSEEMAEYNQDIFGNKNNNITEQGNE